MEGAHMQFILGVLLSENCFEFSITKTWLPMEESTCVLVVVELVEGLNTELDLFGKNYSLCSILSLVGPVTSG